MYMFLVLGVGVAIHLIPIVYFLRGISFAMLNVLGVHASLNICSVVISSNKRSVVYVRADSRQFNLCMYSEPKQPTYTSITIVMKQVVPCDLNAVVPTYPI